MSRNEEKTPAPLGTHGNPGSPEHVAGSGVQPTEQNLHDATLKWIIPAAPALNEGVAPSALIDDQATPPQQLPLSAIAASALGAAPATLLPDPDATPGLSSSGEAYPPTPPAEVFIPIRLTHTADLPPDHDSYPPTPPPTLRKSEAQEEHYPPTPPPELSPPASDTPSESSQGAAPITEAAVDPLLIPTPPLVASAALLAASAPHAEMETPSRGRPTSDDQPTPPVSTTGEGIDTQHEAPAESVGAPATQQASDLPVSAPNQRDVASVVAVPKAPIQESESAQVEGDLELIDDRTDTGLVQEDSDYEDIGPTPPPVPPTLASATKVEPVPEKRTPPPVSPTPPPVTPASHPPPLARHITPPPANTTPPPVTPSVKPVEKSAGPAAPPPIPADTDQGLAVPEQPEALARRSLQKSQKPWFEEIFDEDFLRTLPATSREQTAMEVDFLASVFQPHPGAEVLDIGCGYGRQALAMTQRGFNVTGIDLSLPLLIRAADDAQRQGLAVNFVHADMRELAFDNQFDGAYCMHSSFGYFDEEANLKAATAIFNSLKPGGRFVLEILNRDYVVGDIPSRVWWEGNGCVVLEEVDFNYQTSRMLIHRSIVFGEGRQVEQDISVRAYSLHELGRLLRAAGFRMTEISGSFHTRGSFFGAASRNILAVCEKPIP